MRVRVPSGPPYKALFLQGFLVFGVGVQISKILNEPTMSPKLPAGIQRGRSSARAEINQGVSSARIKSVLLTLILFHFCVSEIQVPVAHC